MKWCGSYLMKNKASFSPKPSEYVDASNSLEAAKTYKRLNPGVEKTFGFTDDEFSYIIVTGYDEENKRIVHGCFEYDTFEEVKR